MNIKNFNRLVERRKQLGQVVNIAHRGFSSSYSDNSIQAILSALSQSYIDGVEFDVQETKDKKLILRHNLSVTTEVGNLWVKDLTLKEIRKTLSKETAPELENVLDMWNGPCLLDIELKSPGICSRIVELSSHKGLYEQTIFSTIYPNIDKEIEAVDANQVRMFGYPRDRGKDLAQQSWTKPFVEIVIMLMRLRIQRTVTNMMNNSNAQIISLYHRVIDDSCIQTINEADRMACAVFIRLPNTNFNDIEIINLMKIFMKRGVSIIKSDYPHIIKDVCI